MKIHIGRAAALSVALIGAAGDAELAERRYQQACQFVRTVSDAVFIVDMLEKQTERMINAFEGTIHVSDCTELLAEELSLKFIKILNKN